MSNPRKYWLMKTEPEVYSWETLVAQGRGCWDGVRNYTARNFLRAMQVGDRVLIYHSNVGKQAVGIAEVVRSHYPDPTIEGDRWSAVDVAPVCELRRPVTLHELKQEYGVPGPLAELRMFRENRLSVVPLNRAEWLRILELAETPEPA
ncbi:MAG: EVE domain-containing protein [Deltaproteobacteria bacterium]|nr:EVE domain-containing protein [Deltaproteobacteria bacterium]